MIKSIKKLVLISIIGGLVLGMWLTYYAVTPLKLQPNSQEIIIQPKSGLRSIANQLVEQGVIGEPWGFILLAKLLSKEQFLQAGSYTLNKNINPYQLLLSLNHGKATQGSVTFIEGRTFSQMRDKLAKNDAVKQTITNLSDAEVMQKMGAKYKVSEGLFFPDTYYFDRNTSDIILLQRSYDAMQRKLAKAWEYRAANLPYENSYQALTYWHAFTN